MIVLTKKIGVPKYKATIAKATCQSALVAFLKMNLPQIFTKVQRLSKPELRSPCQNPHSYYLQCQ